MTTIRLHRHAAEGRPPEQHAADSIGQWLLDHYGEAPRHGIYIFQGEPSADTDITGDVPALLRNDAPYYTVLETPGDPVTLLVNFAIATVINVVASSLFSKEPPPLENRTQESPNNQLSERSNRVRVMERVEDIYGTVRSIPTLMAPTYTKWIQHNRVEYGLYCVGRGFYDVSDIREGDTPLAQINGASAAVYPPFNTPNSGLPQITIGDAIIDKVLSVSRSSSVDGIILKAANQLQLSPNMGYIFRGPGSAGTLSTPLPTTTLDVVYQPERSAAGINQPSVYLRAPNFAAIAEVGQTVTIAMAAQGPHQRSINVTVAGASKTYTSTTPGVFRGMVNGTSVLIESTALDPANVGTRTVVSHTESSFTVSQACVEDSIPKAAVVSVMVNYSGTRTIAEVGVGYVTLTGAPQFPPDYADGITATITVANGASEWTDWFTLPQTDRTEIWTNVVAPNGVYKDDGAKSQTDVGYEIQIEQLTTSLVPTGLVESIAGTVSGATSNERAETLERVTAWVGPARVRMRRTTPFDYNFPGLVVDEIRWMDLYSVSPVTKPHFGNKTIIHTVTRTTAGSTAVARRELNCLAARKLPIFDGTTFSGSFNSEGGLDSGTIAATSRIVDILGAVTVDPMIGGRSLDELDLAQIWAVQQQLDAWHPEVGQFNYTFDSDSISFEETVVAIANAAFCKAYRQNGQIRLALDRPQASSVALFTHRNKKPNAETITRRFASDSDYDGVEMVYTDPDTESQETIRLPLGGGATRLKKVEVSGIRSFAQAWFRGNREYQRLLFERLSIETVVAADGRALLPNSRIDVVDNTVFRSWDGEVVAQAGLTLTLSRDVEFVPAVPHSLVLKKRDGSIQSVAVTAGPQANQVVLAAAPAEAIVTEPTPEGGVRTEFSFAADSARGAQAWLTQSLRIEDDGYVTVTAVNYSNDYYAADALPVPARDSVIN